MTYYFYLILNKSVIALSDLKSAISPSAAKTRSSLQYFHEIPDFSAQLAFYSIKLYINITISAWWALSTSLLFILLIQLVNDAQFLNITFLFALFGAAAVWGATGVVPLTTLYMHDYNYTNLNLTFKF